MNEYLECMKVKIEQCDKRQENQALEIVELNNELQLQIRTVLKLIDEHNKLTEENKELKDRLDKMDLWILAIRNHTGC